VGTGGCSPEVKWPEHLRVVLRLRMVKLVLHLHGVVLNYMHRDNFTFTLPLPVSIVKYFACGIFTIKQQDLIQLEEE
jgi:hypothetical protein